ncbi:hypothetical protein ANTPLA_LOCUS8732 [Anthophora plagiata]
MQIRDNENDSGSDIIIPKKRVRVISESSDDELNGDCTENASVEECLDMNSRRGQVLAVGEGSAGARGRRGPVQPCSTLRGAIRPQLLVMSQPKAF